MNFGNELLLHAGLATGQSLPFALVTDCAGAT